MPRKFYKEDNEAIPAIKFELTQPIGFTEITDSAEIKELYLRQYQYRILDGQEYVQDFTADTYIKVINGIYTDQEAFQLEAHIKDLYQELNNGWWLTAQNTNTNLALLGIYNQILKDEIQAKFDLYVSENY
ncbi:MAG: hypothetical protein QQN55_07155 [Nitrosopumilus sp.]